MLDIKLIREQPELIKASVKAKGFDDSVVDQLLEIDKELRQSIQTAEKLNAEKNKQKGQYSDETLRTALELQSQNNKVDSSIIQKALVELKVQRKDAEKRQKDLDNKYHELMLKIPNPAANDVKVGTPDDNEVIKTVGKQPKFDFEVRDHVDIGQLTDTIDIERGTKVAQSGFYFIKGDGALLEMALINYAVKKLTEKGFTFVITPNVAKEKNIVGCGFQPRSDKERQIYNIEGEDLDLIATSEITLVGMHTDEVLDLKKLPLKYAGYSYCYRTEAGSYGKDVRGILRVHEFRKVEMVVFCLPEESDKWHDKLLAIEEEVWQDLNIPYQVVKMVTGDLGSAASRKYDIEVWMPSQNKYREVTSTSNTTDFQARRLNIKTKVDGQNQYVHTLNGTVVATGRALIAIYENYQNSDGSVTIPEVLRPYMGKDEIVPNG